MVSGSLSLRGVADSSRVKGSPAPRIELPPGPRMPPSVANKLIPSHAGIYGRLAVQARWGATGPM